jgi:hypothetical protein
MMTVACCLAAFCGGCDNWPSLVSQPTRPLTNPFADKPTASVWVAGEMASLTESTPRSTDPTVAEPGQPGVKLFCGANETVSFQVVMDGTDVPMEDIRVECSDLVSGAKARIAASNVHIFRMHPLAVSQYPPWYLRLSPQVPQPANYYDILVNVADPKAGQPYGLAKGHRLAFWVDVTAGRGVPGGLYSGTVKITSSTHATWQTPLHLNVYDFVLPDARTVTAVGGFDAQTLVGTLVRRDGKPFIPTSWDRTSPQCKEGLVAIRQLMLLSHEHRLDLFERRIRPMIKRDTFGKVQLDWEDYDAIVGPYLSGNAFEDRIGCPAWPMPFDADWPEASVYGGPDSDTYGATASDLLSECGRHFKNIGFGDHMFCWPWRGEINAPAYQKYAALARLARQGDHETPILCQLPVAPPAASALMPPANMASLVDIQAAPAQWATLSGAGKLAKPEMPLAGTWLCPGTVPYLPGLAVFAHPADIRAIPWFAMKYDCTGILLPEVLNWPPPGAASGYGVATPPAPAAANDALPQTSRQWHPSDGADQTRLFYPGSMVGAEGIVPSVRLKRLRRGLQDIAYLWILRQRGRAETASAVIGSMVHYGGLEAAGDNYLDPRLDGWAVDPALWELARRLLAQEIVFAVHQHDADSRLLEAQRVLWRDFDDKTHGIRLEQVRSRVVVDPGAKPGEDAPQLVAKVWLDMFNELNHDADVTVALGDLPQGWKAGTGTAHLPAMPADTRAAVELSAAVSGIPIAANGKLTLPVTQTVDLRRRQELGAVISFVQTGRLNKPIKIDGLLDDWPMREGNTAGDFVLIGKRGRGAGAPGDSRTPGASPVDVHAAGGLANRGTSVFVLHDDQNLYIGFRCEEPTPGAMVANADNMIRYDQLMACGEDLVEVILDPGAAAKGPEDLYHIVIKSNGVLVAEKGVHCDPPLGQSTPWPLAASYAVHKGDKFWSVEMAIPFSAFGPAGEGRLWGVNFTRFATQGCEASSWSGAPRYFYDPRNLGTMFVNRVKK